MAAFDQLREEFDRLPKDEQFGLSMAGLFGQYSQGGNGSGSGSHSLFSRDALVEAEMSEKSTHRMSSFMASQTYKVKITDVLTDVINPLEDMFDSQGTRNRLHQNSLHHESTLYYQGIIDAIYSQGKEDRIGRIQAARLMFEQFKRSPIWTSIGLLEKGVIRPMLSVIGGALFGVDRRSDTKKIVDAINNQTHVIKTGNDKQPNQIAKLFREGILSYSTGLVVDGVKGIYGSLFGGQVDTRSEAEKTNDHLTTLTTINEHILMSTSREIRDTRMGIVQGVMAANDSINEQIQATGTDNVVALTGNMSAQHARSMASNERFQRVQQDHNEQQENAYEEYLNLQRKNLEELEEHNKREKRRSLLGAIGKILGGGGMLTALIGGTLASMNDTVRGAIWNGFKYVASKIWDSLGIKGKAGAIGLAILGTPLRSLAGLIGKKLISTLTSRGFVSALTSAFRVSLGPIAAAIGATFHSEKLGGGLDTKPTYTNWKEIERQKRPHQKRLDALDAERRASLAQLQNNNASAESFNALNEYYNKQIEAQKKAIRLIESMEKSIVTPTAQQAAIAVQNGRSGDKKESPIEKSRDGRGKVGGILDYIGDLESRGNYNALVYGKNSPKSADLTNMTIGEVMEYQRGMRGRGHASSAVGKYQFISKTLEGLVRQDGTIDKDSMFDRKTQDRLATSLLKEKGLDDYLSGSLPKEEFGRRIGKVWASVPNKSGKSHYEGIAGNKAGGSYANLMGVLDSPTDYKGIGKNIASNIREGAISHMERSGDIISDASSSAKKRILDVFTGGVMDGAGGLIDGALKAAGIGTANASTEKPAVISNESMDTVAKVMESASMRGFTQAMKQFESTGGNIVIAGDLDD